MFIEVTKRPGQKVLVNVDNIDMIMPNEGQLGDAMIKMNGGSEIYTKEAVHEIYAKIEEEMKYAVGSRASESHAF